MPKGANIVSIHLHKERFNELKTYKTSDDQEYVVLQVNAHSLRKVLEEQMTIAAINGRKMEEEE